MEAEKGLLQEIRHTEEECCMRLEEAKRYAEQVIAEARADSARILSQAEQEGIEEAQRYFDAEMAKLGQEIETIGEGAAQERAKTLARGEENLPAAVQQILSAVAFEV
ncbi:MAG: V-type ATPase subunit subunit G family protein [Methanomicrobiaceae archaeon]|nr:V-type ATPase subunit subunit G family protein [Methanomicrobiaceae archaeon]